MTTKVKRVGLTNGRVGWSDGDCANLSCSYLADRGFHARTIAQATGLSINQVHYRCRMLGIHLRDYRDGKGGIAGVCIKFYTVKTIKPAQKETLRANAARPKVKVKKRKAR